MKYNKSLYNEAKKFLYNKLANLNIEKAKIKNLCDNDEIDEEEAELYEINDD